MGILLTWTSEEGLPLFKEEVVKYFSLSLFVGAMPPFARTGRPFALRYLVLKYLSIYGLILGTPSLFNAHTMILIVHIFMNVNKLCLNQPCALKNALTRFIVLCRIAGMHAYLRSAHCVVTQFIVLGR